MALTQAASTVAGLDPHAITAAVEYREQLMPTGLGHGVAVPHARMEELTKPVIAVGLSRAGIDFNAADGQAAHIIFLLLTPHNDDGVQLDVLTEVAHTLRDADVREKLLEVGTYTEFLALMKSEGLG